MNGRSYALFRALTAIIFIYAGFKHLLHADKILGRIQKCTLYSYAPFNNVFNVLVIVSGVVMIVAAMLLIIGKLQKLSATILLLILIGITLTIQLEDLNDLGPFFKNVAITGSLLFIIKNQKNEIQTS